MRYRVTLTEQTVYEIEAASPEAALSLAVGDAHPTLDEQGNEGDILSCRVDQALPEIEQIAA